MRLAESCCLGLPRCSPPMIASCHGSAWDPTIDQTFMRHMVTHHEQGIVLASIAAEKADDPHLRALSKFMVASQRGRE